MVFALMLKTTYLISKLSLRRQSKILITASTYNIDHEYYFVCKNIATIPKLSQLVDGYGERLEGLLKSSMAKLSQCGFCHRIYIKECYRILDQDALLVIITFIRGTLNTLTRIRTVAIIKTVLNSNWIHFGISKNK